MSLKRIVSIFMVAVFASVCCGCKDGANVSSADSTVTDASDTSGTSAEENGYVLNIKVHSGTAAAFQSGRAYDPDKEDISLILIIGQSNFTTGVGFASEWSYYVGGNTDKAPEAPIVPNAGTAYSSRYQTAITELTESRDMFYISDASNGTATLGGFTPPFAATWSAVTNTKTVFIQMAQGSTGMHEWTPNPTDYTCICKGNGKGLLYANAVEQYKTSFDALSKKYNIVYTGYIWNQGEHDEAAGSQAGVTINSDKAYYDAYKSMHDGLMRELGLDFGAISVVRSHNKGTTAADSNSHTIARAAQYKLCNDIENLYMVSTVSETCDSSMMDQSNTIHYSQSVLNVMGTEAAQNLYKSLGLSDTPAEYTGVKVYSGDGSLIGAFDEEGRLTEGTDTLTRTNTYGQILVKLDSLGTAYTLELESAAGGASVEFADEFGKLEWKAFGTETPVTEVKLSVIKIDV